MVGLVKRSRADAAECSHRPSRRQMATAGAAEAGGRIPDTGYRMPASGIRHPASSARRRLTSGPRRLTLPA